MTKREKALKLEWNSPRALVADLRKKNETWADIDRENGGRLFVCPACGDLIQIGKATCNHCGAEIEWVLVPQRKKG